MKPKKIKRVKLIESHTFADQTFRAGTIATVVKIFESGKLQVRFVVDKTKKSRWVPSTKMMFLAGLPGVSPI
jgi:hypothetical protein